MSIVESQSHSRWLELMHIVRAVESDDWSEVSDDDVAAAFSPSAVDRSIATGAAPKAIAKEVSTND